MASRWNRALFPFSLFIKAIQCFACLFLSSLLGLPYGCKKKKSNCQREKNEFFHGCFLCETALFVLNIFTWQSNFYLHTRSHVQSLCLYVSCYLAQSLTFQPSLNPCFFFLCMGTICQMALVFIFPLFLLLIVMLLLQEPLLCLNVTVVFQIF